MRRWLWCRWRLLRDVWGLHRWYGYSWRDAVHFVRVGPDFGDEDY